MPVMTGVPFTRFGFTRELADLLDLLLRQSLDAVGVAEVTGGYARRGMREDFGVEVWVATDLGLVIGILGTEAKLELTPWVDVVNPEVSIDTVRLDDHRTHVRTRLLIQLPRVDLLGGDDELASLVGALLRAKAR